MNNDIIILTIEIYVAGVKNRADFATTARIQQARDDEGPHFCINQNKNIDNDLYCNYNEFPNFPFC